MKKTLVWTILGLACMCQSIVFSAEDDIVMMVRSPEKMTYSDGSEVGDTGTYVVTWTSSTNSFAGFNADGTLVDSENSKIIVKMPSKNSSLKPFLLQIDKNFVTGGTYQLSFLDTRSRNTKTGKLETAEKTTNSTASVRSYVSLASNVSYSDQFSVLKADDVDGTVESRYVTPAGFYDPLPDFDFSDSEFLTNYVANAVTGEYDRVVFSGTYTNSTSMFFPDPTTGITYYDIYRYFDVYSYLTITNFLTYTNYVAYTNVIDKTVAKYDYQTVYVTNYIDDVETETNNFVSVPDAILSKRSSMYIGYIMDQKTGFEYAFTIKTYRPNIYGVLRITFSTKIGRSYKSAIFYGQVDDYGCITAYGRYSDYRLRFEGTRVKGTIVFNNAKYDILGEFWK